MLECMLLLLFCFAHPLACSLLESKGLFLSIFVSSICGVPRQEITVGLRERWTPLPHPLSIMTTISPQVLPTHGEAWHPAPGSEVERGTLTKKLHLLSTPEKSTIFFLIFFQLTIKKKLFYIGT